METADSRSLVPGHDIPRGATLTRITGGYKGLAEKIPCGLAHCHTGHLTGFEVEFLADGRVGRGRIGNRCGALHFGDTWKVQMREHRQRERVAEMKDDVERIKEACERLLPVLTELRQIALQIEGARRTLRIYCKNLYLVCEDAARRQNGLIVGYGWNGRKVEVPLRGREFWTREDLLPRLNRVLADLRNFPGAATAATSVDRVTGLLKVMGSPYDRAREIVASAAGELDALQQVNMITAVDAFRAVTGEKSVRIHAGGLDAFSTSWTAEPSWVRQLNFAKFHNLRKAIEPLQQAVSLRRVAA